MKQYIKIFISIAILALIFYKIDTKETIAMIAQINLSTILLLFAISLIKFISQAFNWGLCLNIVKHHNYEPVNWKIILKTHIIGLILRLVVLGGLGAFGKIFFINRDKKITTYSILIEKFFIIWIICFFAVWAVIYAPFVSKLDIINSIGFLPLAFIISILPLFLPKFLKKTSVGYVKDSYIKTLPLLITSQIVFIVLTFVQYYVLLKYFVDFYFSFIDVAILVSFILVTNVIPITYSGLGLRESASVWLLPMIGVSPEIAVGTSLIIFFFNAVVPALPGLFFIIKKKGTH